MVIFTPAAAGPQRSAGCRSKAPRIPHRSHRRRHQSRQRRSARAMVGTAASRRRFPRAGLRCSQRRRCAQSALRRGSAGTQARASAAEASGTVSAPEIPERAPIATRTEALNQIQPSFKLFIVLNHTGLTEDSRPSASGYLELLLGAARVLEATALVLLQTPAEAIRHARATVLVLRMARAGACARWRRSGRRARRGPVRTKT